MAPPAPGDLQAVFTALARRAKLPTGPDATPGSVLRAAGLPLLMASMVTGANAGPAAAAPGVGPLAAPDGWTVTSHATPAERHSASRNSSATASARTSSAPSTTRPPAGQQPAGQQPTGQQPTGQQRPGQQASVQATAPRVTYTVREGDTLQKIAELSGRSLPAIVELNQLKPGTEVTPGQVLVLPPPETDAAGAMTKPSQAPPRPAPTGSPSPAPTGAPAAPASKPATPASPAGKAPAGQSPATPPTVTVTVTATATPAPASTPLKAAPAKPPPAKAPAKPAPATAPAAPAKAPAAPAKAPTRPASPTTYVVQPGDTVIHIATRYGRSAAGIIKLNRLPPNGLIHPGDVLKLPPLPGTTAPSPAPTKAAPARTAPAKAAPAKAAPPKAAPAPSAPATRPYVVRDGDTLLDICAREKVDLQKVLGLNKLRLDAIIRPGQRLLLPAPPPVKKTANNTFLGRTYPPAVVAAADANRKALSKKSLPTREQAKAMITATARRNGVDPALVLAIAYQESGFNQRVVSPANAVGVMQVIPSAGKWASDLSGQKLDLLDTQDNITAGVVLLRALTQAADNDAQAIAGYYQGLSSVRKNGMYDDTRRYVANIQTLRSRFAKTL